MLLVEDTAALAKALARRLASLAEVRIAATVADARAFVRSTPLLAALVDVGLPDGSGLEIVSELHRMQPGIPALVFTGSVEPEVVNAAHALGAEVAIKSADFRNVDAFLRRVAVARYEPDGRAQRHLSAYAIERGLTIREVEILALAVRSAGHKEIADVLGVSSNTLKTQVRGLLDRCDAASLGDLAWRLQVELKHGRRAQ